MEVKAKHKYARVSSVKVRKLVGVVKGKTAEVAISVLKFLPQKAANILCKLLRSAVANADQNTSLDIDELIVKDVVVDQGPSLKRFRARARGRGSRILKRTSHITVVLVEVSA